MPRPPRRGQPQAQRHHVPDRRPGVARRRGRRCGGEGRRGAGPAARRAGQHQGEYRPEGPADAQRRRRLQGRDRAGGFTRGRQLAQGGRSLHRPHQCAGLFAALGHRQCAARPHLQSVGQGRARPGGSSGGAGAAVAVRHRSDLPRQRLRRVDPLSRPIAAASPASARPWAACRPSIRPRRRSGRRPFAMFAVQGPLARRVQGRAPWPPCHERARCARPVVGAGASSWPLPQRPIKVGLITEAPGLRPSEGRGSGAQGRRHPEQCRLRGRGSDAAVDRGRARTVGEAGRRRHPRAAVGDHRGQRRSARRQGGEAVARRAAADLHGRIHQRLRADHQASARMVAVPGAIPAAGRTQLRRPAVRDRLRHHRHRRARSTCSPARR